MKKTSIFALAALALILAATSCRPIQYVPIETVRTEYRNNYLRDSIYFRDSVFFAIKGDTVFLEKYRYLYRDKIVRDSIFKTDTIRTTITVTEKGKLSKLQSFQMWVGWFALVLLCLWLFWSKIRRK